MAVGKMKCSIFGTSKIVLSMLFGELMVPDIIFFSEYYNLAGALFSVVYLFCLWLALTLYQRQFNSLTQFEFYLVSLFVLRFWLSFIVIDIVILMADHRNFISILLVIKINSLLFDEIVFGLYTHQYFIKHWMDEKHWTICFAASFIFHQCLLPTDKKKTGKEMKQKQHKNKKKK